MLLMVYWNCFSGVVVLVMVDMWFNVLDCCVLRYFWYVVIFCLFVFIWFNVDCVDEVGIVVLNLLIFFEYWVIEGFVNLII